MAIPGALLTAAPQTKPSVGDHVEAIGFGQAQLTTVLIAIVGASFMEGSEVMLSNFLTIPVGTEFGLSDRERASIASVAYVGMVLGVLVSGNLGDIGRRRPVVWGFFIALCSCLGCAAAPNYWILLFCRFFQGVGFMFSFGPACSMASETSPVWYRIPVQALGVYMYSFGMISVSAVAYLDDPTLQALRWRKLMVLFSCPIAVFWLLSLCLLEESPVFLASVGERQAALEGLRRMARQNGCTETVEDYNDLEANPPSTLIERLSVIFSPRFVKWTFTVIFANFCLSAYTSGIMYAAPQVLNEVGSLRAGAQTLGVTTLSLVWPLVTAPIAQVLPRNRAMCLAATIGALGCTFFSFCGQWTPPRAVPLEIGFQAGLNMPPICMGLGVMAIQQFSVETYPTTASSTAASVVQLGALAGYIMAPLGFEEFHRVCGHWSAFFVVLVVAFICAAGATALLKPLPPREERKACYGSLAVA